jgi:hypothetical protein
VNELASFHPIKLGAKQFKIKVKKNCLTPTVLLFLLPLISLIFNGCSTSLDNVQPVGKPGLIQGGIPVEIIQYPVKVAALDVNGRTITLKHADGSMKVFDVSASVNDLDEIKVGDPVKATVKAELSVYILDHGRLTNADGTSRPKTINFNAKVLQVDASNRLLTLKFTNGHTMTIKADSNMQLGKMAPGDDVVMRSNLVTKIEVTNP